MLPIFAKPSLSIVPNSGCSTPGSSFFEIITIVPNDKDCISIINLKTQFDKIVENNLIINSFINALNSWFFQIKE